MRDYDHGYPGTVHRQLQLARDLELLRTLKRHVSNFTSSVGAEPYWAPETHATELDFRQGRLIGATHAGIGGAALGRLFDEALDLDGAGACTGAILGVLLGMCHGHSSIKRGWRTKRLRRQ